MNFEAMNILDPATGMAPESFDLASLETGEEMTPSAPSVSSRPMSTTPNMSMHSLQQTPTTVPDEGDSTELPLNEIVNMVPPESKENKWKPAPVSGTGRLITAKPLISD
jgi:hypothetical protein